jgi:hypothetical protein
MIEGDRRKLASAKLSTDGGSAGIGSSFLLDYESGSQNDQIGHALVCPLFLLFASGLCPLTRNMSLSQRKAEELMEEQLGRLKMRSKEVYLCFPRPFSIGLQVNSSCLSPLYYKCRWCLG